MGGLLRRLLGGRGDRTKESSPGEAMGRREGAAPEKVVMGLGNPGPQYHDTRHNVGWWVVDRLAAEWGAGSFAESGPALTAMAPGRGRRVLLAKPITYMNRSGAAVRSILQAHPHLDPAEDLLVVVDDATRAVGGVRFRPGGSAGGHRGLRSVAETLGSDDYPRLRVGVGEAPQGADLAQWVLSPMPAGDEEELTALLPELVEAVEVWLEEGTRAAMNRFNR